MKTFSFYLPETGEIHSLKMYGSAHLAALNTPSGYVCVEGDYDSQCQRITALVVNDQGDAVPVVEDWQPPEPPDDAMQTWSWDAAAKRWISAPTLAARTLEAKAERMTRLERCDWVAARAFETGQPVPPAWLSYRQALRDITEQPGFPDAIEWPTQPAT